MRQIAALLAVVAIVGCKDSKVSVDLTGQPAVPAPPRYQIVSGNLTGNRSEVFLLDTQRGRVWGYEPYDSRYISTPSFSPIRIIDDEGVLGPTMEQMAEAVKKVAEEKKSLSGKHE